MHYDVFIIDNDRKFNNFKEYSKNILKNIRITILDSIENKLEELEYVDILVVDIDAIDLFEIVKPYLKSDIYKIFIINDNSDLAKIPKSKESNFLYHPLDFEKLSFKIKYYTDIFTSV